jgi:hypothetical protein
MSTAALAAIEFALGIDPYEAHSFLSNWSEGEFADLREGWPTAPETVYIGADPLHPLTKVETELFVTHVEFPPDGRVHNTKVFLSNGCQLRGIFAASQSSDIGVGYQEVSLRVLAKGSAVLGADTKGS